MTQQTETKIEPIQVSMSDATIVTGESRTVLIDAIKAGELDCWRAGRRVMLSLAQLKARCLNRPKGLAKEPPWLVRAREKRERATKARRKIGRKAS
jgi:hypothetical protein